MRGTPLPVAAEVSSARLRNKAEFFSGGDCVVSFTGEHPAENVFRVSFVFDLAP